MNVETLVGWIIHVKKGELLYKSSKWTLFNMNWSNYDMEFTSIEPMYTPPSPSQAQCCFLISKFEKNVVSRIKVFFYPLVMLKSNLEPEPKNLSYIFLNTIFIFYVEILSIL